MGREGEERGMENGVVYGRMSVKRGRGTWNGEWCGVGANECEERARNVEWRMML